MSEAELAGWLADELKSCGARVEREVNLGGARADLLVSAQRTAAIEVKPSSRSRVLCVALGQALSYRAAGVPFVGVAAPHDEVPRRILDAYESAEVQLLSLFPDAGYTRIQPAFPDLYRDSAPVSSYPWGKVNDPHPTIEKVHLSNYDGYVEKPDGSPLVQEVLNCEQEVYRLLCKFHKETECGDGEGRYHWSECDAVADAFGYGSWEGWFAEVNKEGN